MNFSSKSVRFNPATDIPSLTSKVILVTGGNIGLGKQAIIEFARHRPACIYLCARDLSKANKAVEEIKTVVPSAPIKLLSLDLTSFESVQQAAEKFLAQEQRLDILMLNAGIMATPPGVTKEGYEVQFGTNHMGHALLTKLLLPVLVSTAALPSTDVRVVALTSYGHNYTPKAGLLFPTLKTPAEQLGPFERYGQSKLANILFISQLAKRYPQLTTASVHPGVVQTNLATGASDAPWWFKVFGAVGTKLGGIVTVEKGVRNQVWAATGKGVESGRYYEPVGVGGKVSEMGRDEALAESLWDWTEGELEVWLTSRK